MMITPQLQRQKNITVAKDSEAGLFPPKKMTILKRKISATSSSDDVFSLDSNDRYSAFSPCRPSKKRRTSSSSSCSGCSSSSGDSQESSWLNKLLAVFSSTIHECKVGVSKVYPWPVGFTMQCKALLQDPDPVTGAFGLMVLFQRVGGDRPVEELCSDERYQVAGGSIKPKIVTTGSLCVRLLSHDLEADVQHGEHASLMKFQRFGGRDFEMQFACKFKRIPSYGGVFAKVLVEHIDDYGNSEVMFDFNLSKNLPEAVAKQQPVTVMKPWKPKTSDESRSWSSLAIRELATLLCIDEDDETWMDFAVHLGYSEDQVEEELAVTSDPVMAILSMYQSQGRDAKDFVQAMYETSRKTKLRKAGLDNSETLSEFEAFNMRSYSQQTAEPLTKVEEEKVALALKEINSLENEGINLEKKDNSDDPFDAATVVLPDQTAEVEEMKEVPSTAVMPPTPPPTPERRGWSESTNSLPGEHRIQLMSRDMAKVLYSTPENPEDHEHRECGKLVSDSILWQISGHVQEKWKSLGRALDVKEIDLMLVEFSTHDTHYRAYRTLCRWRDNVADKPTFGMLYTALCHPIVQLNMIANRYCTLDGVGVA